MGVYFETLQHLLLRWTVKLQLVHNSCDVNILFTYFTASQRLRVSITENAYQPVCLFLYNSNYEISFPLKLSYYIAQTRGCLITLKLLARYSQHGAHHFFITVYISTKTNNESEPNDKESKQNGFIRKQISQAREIIQALFNFPRNTPVFP